MAAFLEERFPIDISYGSSFGHDHATHETEVYGGDTFVALRHPYVRLSYDVMYEAKLKYVMDKVVDLYDRANGKFRGFRVRDVKDFTSNAYNQTPTAFDQPMLLVNPITPGIYQLMRWYGNPADSLCARRRVRKPVAGTVKVGVGGKESSSSQWTLDGTTGIVTLTANKIGTITAITKGSTTQISVANTYTVGETVYVSGVLGMVEINGLRGTITARSAGSITLDINSSSFTNYTSGGTTQTWPQSGEAVTAGFEFDIPCQFDADFKGTFPSWEQLSVSGLPLVERLNP